MAKFQEDLMRLKQGGFLSGLAILGQNIAEQKQNETLVEAYNKFKLERDKLMTTEEQVSQTNKRADNFTLDGEEVPDDIKQTVDLYSHIDRIEAYQDLYQPYINAFMTLGEDGVRIASSLSQDLADKITIEQMKSEVPFKELQYQNLKMTYDWNMEKFADYIDNREMKEQIAGIADEIIRDESFQEIPFGTVKTWSEKKFNHFTNLSKAVIDKMHQKYGGNVSKGVITQALSVAMQMTGRKLIFDELTPSQMGYGRGGNPTDNMMAGAYYNTLLAWSNQRKAMSPETWAYVEAYMKNGSLPLKDDITAPDQDWIMKMAEIFKPDGHYNDYFMILQSFDPKLREMETFSVIPEIKDEKGNVTREGVMGSKPVNPIYGEIYVPNGMDSFMIDDFDYRPENPYNWMNQQREFLKSFTDPNFERGGADEYGYDMWNSLYHLRPNAPTVPMVIYPK